MGVLLLALVEHGISNRDVIVVSAYGTCRGSGLGGDQERIRRLDLLGSAPQLPQ